MASKKFSLGFTAVLMLSQISYAFAGQAIILSDYELDQIHAGGLNFNFDSYLGSVGTSADSVTKGPVTLGTQNNPFLVNTNNPNVKVSLSTPTSPKSPAGADTTNIVAPSNASSASSAGSSLPSSSLASSLTDVENPLSAHATPSVTVGPEVPITPVETVGIMKPETTNIPDSSLASGAPLGGAGSIAQNAASSQASQANVVAANSALPADAAGATSNQVAPSNNINVTVPTQTAAPTTPTSPAAITSPYVLDVLAANHGGNFKVAVANSGGNNVIPIPFSTTGGGINSVNVTDTAQQQLSAFVNINAAGSIVPVQINLTVLMNSTVGNVNNSNDLKLSNYSIFQIQP